MFNVKKVEEVKQMLEQFNQTREVIEIKTSEALHMTLAEDIVSKFDVPHFSRSTVDGYAVNHKDVRLASTNVPVLLDKIGEVEMGHSTTLEINKNTIYVPTGGFLPLGADSVVMIENTEELGNEIVIYQAPSVGENVLKQGSDVSNGDKILFAKTKITERHIGLLTSVGVHTVKVLKPLTAVVISTGDEIVSPEKTPKLGEIRDINTYTVANFLKKRGVRVLKTFVIKDNFQKYLNEVDNAIKAVDMVITSGGSSVGDKDYTINILNDLNAEVFAHGINIKPGKPTIIARLEEKFFFGLPGQPLSAYTVLNALFDHYLVGMGELMSKKHTVQLPLSKNVHAAPGRVTYQLVRVTDSAEPVFTKSGMITGLASADGYIILEENSEGKNKGEQVEVILFD